MKNFLFDLYGTLADIETDEESPEFWERVGGMLHTDGRAAAQTYRKLCGNGLPDWRETDLLPVMEKLVALYGAQYGAADFAEAFRAASVKRLRRYPAVFELLAGLRQRGAKTYLLSTAQACFTYPELCSLGLADKFDGIVLSSEIGWKKPSPHFFERALKKFSLKAHDCVYIGNDLRDDVGGAQGVGIRTVYIQTAQSGRYADPPAADITVTSHEELLSTLFSLAEEPQ